MNDSSEKLQNTLDEIDAEISPTFTDSQRDEMRIQKLAALPDIEYERIRGAESKTLGISTARMDKLVEKAKREPKRKDAAGRQIKLYEPKPWESAVNGADALQDALNVIMRHMVMREEDAIACVLWAVHTYIYAVFDHTPRLMITAPDAECGKTALMAHMVGNLVNRPQTVELMKAGRTFSIALHIFDQ